MNDIHEKGNEYRIGYATVWDDRPVGTIGRYTSVDLDGGVERSSTPEVLNNYNDAVAWFVACYNNNLAEEDEITEPPEGVSVVKIEWREVR